MAITKFENLIEESLEIKEIIKHFTDDMQSGQSDGWIGGVLDNIKFNLIHMYRTNTIMTKMYYHVTPNDVCDLIDQILCEVLGIACDLNYSLIWNTTVDYSSESIMIVLNLAKIDPRNI